MSPNCPADAVMMDLSQVTTEIPNILNAFRNEIAAGTVEAGKLQEGDETEYFPPAYRMGTLQWNVTLANLARKNVKECAIAWHDNCRNTPDNKYVGQNVAYYIDYRNTSTTNWEAIQEMLYLMTNQSRFAIPSDIESYPANGDE